MKVKPIGADIVRINWEAQAKEIRDAGNRNAVAQELILSTDRLRLLLQEHNYNHDLDPETRRELLSRKINIIF